MKNILCYGDSNFWGYIPGSDAGRYPFEVRIPGVIQKILEPECRVVEDGLNSRTTMYEDPENPDKNGLAQLPDILEISKPLDLIAIMLGTNDMKNYLELTPADSVAGIKKTLELIRNAGCGVEGVNPIILLIAPPAIVDTPTGFPHMLGPAVKKSLEYSTLYREVAEENNCLFLDAAEIVETPRTDGIHLDEACHKKLGEAIAGIIKEAIGVKSDNLEVNSE